MTAFTPTPEQLAIVAAARDTQDNLLISALAGAAKTSTLVLIAEALPGVNTLCLAFNKRIADEMKTRLPANCTSQTLNSLGHRAWASAIPVRLRLDTKKTYNLFQEEIASFPEDSRKPLWDNFGFILSQVQGAKSAGHLPDEIALARPKNTRLIDDAELYDTLDETPTEDEWAMILRILSRSAELAFEGVIDFADQLLMPTIFRAPFPIFSLILVDEAQDLSELNHAMLAKIYRRRIIAVGDACQAIYAFRGAHEDSMALLAKRFSMRELTLSCSFRCPKAIVRHVNWRAPHMRHWPNNPHAGLVTRAGPWNIASLPDSCAIICRNNAPLFSLAIAILRSGRYPNLWGNDIGRGLIKILGKLGPAQLPQAEAIAHLNSWHNEQSRRQRSKRVLRDKYECLRIFIEAAPTLGASITYAEELLRSSGNIDLLTGHKSKGHEWEHVYFLDEHLVGDEGQEPNLRYVIATRSLRTLTYINSSERNI